MPVQRNPRSVGCADNRFDDYYEALNQSCGYQKPSRPHPVRCGDGRQEGPTIEVTEQCWRRGSCHRPRSPNDNRRDCSRSRKQEYSDQCCERPAPTCQINTVTKTKYVIPCYRYEDGRIVSFLPICFYIC